MVSVNYLRWTSVTSNGISWVKMFAFFKLFYELFCRWNFQENTGKNDIMDAVSAFALVIILLGIIFFLSEFGEMVSTQFAAFNERWCQCDWYLFPIEIQRMFGAFMMNTQESVIIRGYGNACCNREIFEVVSSDTIVVWLCSNIHPVFALNQVVHSSYTYFMVLRKFR